ncbi:MULTISPECIES: YjzD family protein [Bacillus]|uniref:YjzD family protein n=1 Tax=Bacillus TaxID=1386 RepID=UPI000BB86EEA|nr:MULTISPECIES: YjzD family protein [Bacillus]
MRFFWTLVWSLLLVNMISYVIASMQGDTYNYVIASGVAVVFTLVISLIGAVLPNEPVEKH